MHGLLSKPALLPVPRPYSRPSVGISRLGLNVNRLGYPSSQHFKRTDANDGACPTTPQPPSHPPPPAHCVGSSGTRWPSP